LRNSVIEKSFTNREHCAAVTRALVLDVFILARFKLKLWS